jgi:predicted amino acid dehydrogenase
MDRTTTALISLVALAGVAIAGCGSSAEPGATGVVKVVAAENFWGDVARQIGGSHVDVTSVVNDPAEDPHQFESDARTAAAVADADLVILLTASADSLLRSEHLAPGAVVLDATQPRNTAPSLVAERADVLVVDGGIVSIPSLQLLGGDIGLPQGRSYACFAETALLALSGHRSHFSIGVPTLELVDRTRELARDLGHLGFHAAEPTSFGQPLGLGGSVPVAS